MTRASANSTVAVDERFAAVLAALDRAHDLAARYIASLPERPVARSLTADDMASFFDEPLPEAGSDPAEAVAEWYARAEPGIVASSGPRFFGWVMGGTTPAALAGDWLAAAIDQDAGMWTAAPAAAQTELTVLRWVKDLFGLPAAWAGAVTSGATMSNLVGLAAGRQWVGHRLGFDAAKDGLGGRPPIPVVSSAAIHASARKSLGTLGIGRGSVRTVAAPGGAVDLDALAAELATIDGPVIVVANAGEVNSGAFDDLHGVADLCAAHSGGAWLHIDGAFGLFAAVSPAYQHLTAGVERADSVCVDAHKWLNVPYDAGFAFVRDAGALGAAFAATAAYLTPPPGAGWNPDSHLPEMSRRFRGLAAWCALKAYGRAGYRELVERCCANAAAFATWIVETPGVELMAPAPLNIVCWRYAPAGLDEAARDEINHAAAPALQADGRTFVTPTTWEGRAALRCAFDNWSTTAADVAILQQAVAEVGQGLVAQ
ncbi:MAG: pyridoxal phosphate-dependent decarboxylase family protein [Thermomicrobiales bacterium]